MSFKIYHNFNISVPSKQVFHAVSQPKHLDNWWTLKSSGIAKLGETYNLNFTDQYDWYCKILKLETDKSIHFKMTKCDTDWLPTTFGFNLEEIDRKTNVEFSHVDWKEINDHFKIASFCWAMLLNGLKNYLEKGIIVPFTERN
ncbi:SRPBCC domain-containing protein [Aestuariivivens sp. NBU2969]|uniref:SRPBCC family protein n=1 Tax=Aestuariivivens sp. NBU2969 TaxID=2873267 RepID=UPI001CBDBF4B|nr:SRPBCC domain-containing protein [Aestuariivivens sp. NBU2969]